MEWISAKTASENWGVHVRRVQGYCAAGKIPGAKLVGKQWMLPADALRPNDGRTRQGKEQPTAYPYRFPLFTHSTAFAAPDGLTEDEKALLEAQTLYLKADFARSMEICRELEKNSPQLAVRFGAAVTTGFDAIALGLCEPLRDAAARADALAAQDPDHGEDYRFLSASLHFHRTWDCKPLLAIDTAKMSRDAYYYYQPLIVHISIVTATVESAQAVKIYDSLCQQATVDGVLPAAMSLHFELAALGIRQGLPIDSADHLKAGCAIARENGWDYYLTKHYFLAPKYTEEFLTAREKARVKKLIPLLTTSAKIIWKANSAKNIAEHIGPEHPEFLHLMMYGLSDRKIAAALGISAADVRRQIAGLCASLQLPDRKALVQYANEQFANILG